MVNWDSTGLVIAHSSENFADLSSFSPESMRKGRGRATRELSEANVRRKLPEFAQIERIAENPSSQNRLRAIILRAAIPVAYPLSAELQAFHGRTDDSNHSPASGSRGRFFRFNSLGAVSPTDVAPTTLTLTRDLACRQRR